MSKTANFSGHETFPFRYTWLRKAWEGVKEDPSIFSREDALVRLGVGKNMVKSIRFWATACRIIEECSVRTRGDPPRHKGGELGKLFFDGEGYDPYFEDPMTLWLLHWELAHAQQCCTTWYYAFNLMPKIEFTRHELVTWLRVWAETNQIDRKSTRLNSSHIPLSRMPSSA